MAKDIFLTGIVDEFMLNELMYQVRNTTETDLNIYMGTPGGYVDDAFRIAQYIEGVSDKKNITNHIFGNTDSAGTIIFLSAKNRKAAKYSAFMVHNPAVLNIDIMDNDKTDRLKSMLDFNKERIASYYESKIPNLNRSKLKSMMSKETFMTAEEMKQYGIVDEVLDRFDIAAFNKSHHNYLINKTKNMGFFDKSKKVKNYSVKLTEDIQAVFSSENNELTEGLELNPIGEVENLKGEYTVNHNDKKYNVVVNDKNSIEKVEESSEVTNSSNEAVKALSEQFAGVIAEMEKKFTERIENMEKRIKNETSGNIMPDEKELNSGNKSTLNPVINLRKDIQAEQAKMEKERINNRKKVS
jgi:ATP-dependent Clp protease protease subunit